MTIVVIDECGDLGEKGTRYFVISAVIALRSRILLETSKLIDNSKGEMKYSNSNHDTREKIIQSISKADLTIVCIIIDKKDPNSNYYGLYGKKLYKTALSNLISSLSNYSKTVDMKIMIDRTSAISKTDIDDIIDYNNELNIINFKKYDSRFNKCIQIADFVVGAIWHMYERNEQSIFDIIKKIGSVACEPRWQSLTTGHTGLIGTLSYPRPTI